jgi:hypothetical protein
MIEHGFISVEIAKELDMSKAHVSYYVNKGRRLGYIKETGSKKLELAQPGKVFLDRCEKQNLSLPVCRAENIRFKAVVTKMPPIPPNWKKVQMHNWAAYTSEVDSVIIKLNIGKVPTVEFIPSPVEGDNPFHLYSMLLYESSKAAQTLEDTIGMEVGKLELSSRAEWLTYDPLARSFCKIHGQVRYEGIAKVNASKPRDMGEFEFHDPRALHDYLLMPQRLKNVESTLRELSEIVERLFNKLGRDDDSKMD